MSVTEVWGFAKNLLVICNNDPPPDRCYTVHGYFELDSRNAEEDLLDDRQAKRTEKQGQRR